jgi:hypothetical protein
MARYRGPGQSLLDVAAAERGHESVHWAVLGDGITGVLTLRSFWPLVCSTAHSPRLTVELISSRCRAAVQLRHIGHHGVAVSTLGTGRSGCVGLAQLLPLPARN